MDGAVGDRRRQLAGCPTSRAFRDVGVFVWLIQRLGANSLPFVRSRTNPPPLAAKRRKNKAHGASHG